MGGFVVVWCRPRGDEQTAIAATYDDKKRDGLLHLVDVASRGRCALASARGAAHVVVGRGPTACRATLNYVLKVSNVQAPRGQGVMGYAVLSDGAFLHATLKPLTLRFNRVVKIPKKKDVHRLVVEGFIMSCQRHDLARAADTARARGCADPSAFERVFRNTPAPRYTHL